MTKIIDDVYLGDGVYASFDGYHIVLDLRGQDNHTRIALEPIVMEALVNYRDAINSPEPASKTPDPTQLAKEDE
jgi:hypothetical protein